MPKRWRRLREEVAAALVLAVDGDLAAVELTNSARRPGGPCATANPATTNTAQNSTTARARDHGAPAAQQRTVAGAARGHVVSVPRPFRCLAGGRGDGCRCRQRPAVPRWCHAGDEDEAITDRGEREQLLD